MLSHSKLVFLLKCSYVLLCSMFSLCDWHRKSLYLLQEGQDHPIVRFASAFLATRMMHAHHISSTWWEVDLIYSYIIGSLQLSMPRRQGMLLVCFWVCTHCPFCRTECCRTFHYKSVKCFSNPQSRSRSKTHTIYSSKSRTYTMRINFSIKVL